MKTLYELITTIRWVLILVCLLLVSATVLAGSATWNLNPTDNLWGTASNWTPATVPNEPTDTATFDVSNITDIVDHGFPSSNTIDGIVFNPGASAFTISVQSFSSLNLLFTFSGFGITNNSGITQNFVSVSSSGCCDSGGVIQFMNSATAGDRTVFTNAGLYTATKFFDTSTAGNSTLIASGEGFGGAAGTILFAVDSTGGTARVKVFDDGNLDMSPHNAPGVTVGSIEGSGDVFLGANNLTVGSSDLSTAFSGIIQDGGSGGGTGGSLTKMGTGKLVLTNANTYSGGTTISGGAFFVHNRMGSATGSGAVQVDAGRLAGRGIIAGPVTVGRGSGALADLSPGEEVKPGTLKCLSTLTFNNKGSYLFQLDSGRAIADQVIANGVTIRSRAHFFPADLGSPILSSAELYDSTNETWMATGNLANPHELHTATLLSNGQVLVAAGFNDRGFSASADLYDPASGNWTPTGSLITGGYAQTATLLPNGQVLVAGGYPVNGVSVNAELYDPASGSWSATNNLVTARFQHTATLLPNGQVLAAGGEDNLLNTTASAELYDPASGTWTAAASLATAREVHTATLLPDGKVLVAGGFNLTNGELASAELYDPASGTWTRTGRLTSGRYYHTATLLPNGRVLVTGGFGASGDLASAELYDPASGTWTATGSLETARHFHTATLLPNGQVLVAGGTSNSSNLASAELYDPASGLWTTTDSLATGRTVHTATLLSDGRLLVAGGFGAGLPIGTVFTAINNTSATPISGTFSNLADGSTLTIGQNSFTVSYSGGDGNDLTLTVQ